MEKESFLYVCVLDNQKEKKEVVAIIKCYSDVGEVLLLNKCIGEGSETTKYKIA